MYQSLDILVSVQKSAPLVLTRNWGAKSHEGNGVDTILEVNEAAEMAGNVTNDRGAQTHRGDGYHEGGITIGNG